MAARLLGERYRYIYPQHLNYFTLRTLQRLVANRFAVLECRSTHFNPLVIWQDWRGGGAEVPNQERAQLLRRTTALKQHQLLSEHEYREARETYGADAFEAKMGAEAVRDALGRVDLQQCIDQLQQAMGETKSKQIRKKIAKRIKLLTAFLASKVRPEWMVLTVLPVIPPDLRPFQASVQHLP